MPTTLPIGEFQTTAYRCRCGHEWVPKGLRHAERPRVCPKCKSANWDRPKRKVAAAGREETANG